MRYVAEALVKVGEPASAADVYQRLGDHRKVAQLAVAVGEWNRAFSLAREHPECKRDVYLPYAHQMAKENKFVESQKAYYMAGETATAMRVFTILVANAVTEERFSDAGYLHHLLAVQCLDTAGNCSGKERDTSLLKYAHNEHLARIYHAYESVHRCIHEPFSLSQPDTLLNAARYVLGMLEGDPPPGVSMFCLYLCLAKQAKALNVLTLAQQMLDKILSLQIPQKFQESVELLMIKSRASGVSESRDDEVAPLCWRCRRHVPPLSAVRCAHCRHALVHSLATHEVLPLVRFEPEEGITYEEALELIERTPLPEAVAEIRDTGGAEVLQIESNIDSVDPFLDKVDEEDESGIVVCSRYNLLQMCPASVVLVKRPQLQPLFYKNVLPELPVTTCPQCHNLFYLEDYEIQLVVKGHCPFCRHPAEEPKNPEETDDSSYNDSTASTPVSPSNGQSSWR